MNELEKRVNELREQNYFLRKEIERLYETLPYVDVVDKLYVLG